ncbi:hypothetical protein BBJ28_00001992 [Nothophytophthora sp. Chile5]|nr:hypothetical protein BBJ28_00001992 [Nothophytophthora sp. Chile5]
MSLKREGERALALPAISEHAKMPRVLPGSPTSPRVALPRAPSLSPSSSSRSVSSVASNSSSLLVMPLVPTTEGPVINKQSVPKPKKPTKRQKAKGYSPSQWRRPNQLPPRQQKEHFGREDEDFVPIRRRFHSSDLILRGPGSGNAALVKLQPPGNLQERLDGSALALRRWFAARVFDGAANSKASTTSFIDSTNSEPPPSSEDEYEPEPPLADPAELVRLAQRRRTCSENYTKSSRTPSAFFPEVSCHPDEAKRDEKDQESEEEEDETPPNDQIGKEEEEEEEEHKSEDESQSVDEGFEAHDEEEDVELMDAGERQPSSYYEGSWASPSSSVLQYGIPNAVGYTPGSSFTSHYSIESDGQNLEKLRNLQKLYQEGFITVTEYKDRRVQLVDELSEADQTIAKTSDLLSLELPIIYREPPDFSLLRERDAIKHVFDSEQRKWTSSCIKVKIDTEPFAKGGLRQVFHLQDLSVPPPVLAASEGDEEEDGSESSDSVLAKCTSYVAKVAINPDENPDTYFRDVEMQAVAAKYAMLYNSYNPPRRVEFLEAWILQLIPTGASDGDENYGDGDDEEKRVENLTLRGTICGVEPFIAGEYHKHNNNFGYVSELERNTPQTFSHFSYEASGQQILVVDIQGVGDHYTDPQIHTRRGKEFGKGNMAIRGFERFLASHRCNPICRYLKLPLINFKEEGSGADGDGGAVVDPKGTIPAQTYMSQPRVVVNQVDSVLCHYYGDSMAFKRYHAKKKRERKKREKQQQHLAQEQQWQVQQDEGEAAGRCGSGGVGSEGAAAVHQVGSKFAAALLDQQRSCSSFVCGGIPQCIVS